MIIRIRSSLKSNQAPIRCPQYCFELVRSVFCNKKIEICSICHIPQWKNYSNVNHRNEFQCSYAYQIEEIIKLLKLPILPYLRVHSIVPFNLVITKITEHVRIFEYFDDLFEYRVVCACRRLTRSMGTDTPSSRESWVGFLWSGLV